MPSPPTSWAVDGVKEFRAGDCRVPEATKVPDHLIKKNVGSASEADTRRTHDSIFAFLPRPLLRISRVVSCILKDLQM